MLHANVVQYHYSISGIPKELYVLPLGVAQDLKLVVVVLLFPWLVSVSQDRITCLIII